MAMPDRFLSFPCSVSPEASAREAARKMREAHVGSLVVIDDGRKPIGIVTDRDVALHVLVSRSNPEQVLVHELMSRPVHTIRSSQDLADAARVMRSRGVRRLPIVDDAGRLVGIVASDDMMQLIGHELGDLAGAVRRGIAMESASDSHPSRFFGKE